MMPAVKFRQEQVVSMASGATVADYQRRADEMISRRAIACADRKAYEDLTHRATVARANALSKLPYLLELLELQCGRNGIQVHWAETVEDANHTVLALMEQNRVGTLVRSNCRIVRELDLDPLLERQGHHVRVAPNGGYTDKELPIEQLDLTEPVDWRGEGESLLIGLTAADFLVAKSGSLCVLDNTGGSRMIAAMADVHIAVAGIEQVVESLSDLPALLSVLARSAQGDQAPAGVSLISKPRSRGELDGPQEIHLVLVDNGRSTLYANKELSVSLRCIGCGACASHCPVYIRSAGTWGVEGFPGPIGVIQQAGKQLTSVDKETLSASTGCAACTEVCPVGIPLHTHLKALESRLPNVGGFERFLQVARKLRWKSMAWVLSDIRRYRLIRRVLPVFSKVLHGQYSQWLVKRKAPVIASQSLRDQLKNLSVADE